MEIHAGLRNDVRLLGDLLGETLRDQEGQWLLDVVETIRQASKQARSANDAAAGLLPEQLSELNDHQLILVARAFSQFLNLANIAEQYHRVRRRREYQQSPTQKPQPQSLAEVLSKLKKKAVSPEAIASTLQDMKVELVLTAHPTEVTRRTLIQKFDDISGSLERIDRMNLTAAEQANETNYLRRKIAAAWHTDEIRHERPTPVDEARWGFVTIEQTLWDAVPRYLREIDATLMDAGLEPLPETVVPVRFASWMGGDRDGNPNVTARVTAEVILLARWMAAELIQRDLKQLHHNLSMHDCNAELRELVGETSEPYRVLLKQLRGRVTDTLDWIEHELNGQWHEGEQPIEDINELLEPLTLCYRSLTECGMAVVAEGDLKNTLRRLHCFGLYVLRLDVRQESTRHANVLDTLTRYLGLGSYHQWDEAAKQAFLLTELQSKRPLIPDNMPADDEVQEVLDTFRMLARQAPSALGAYVISMATFPSDVLAVMLLQKAAGMKTFMRVVPLFETLADLQGADKTLEALLENDWYRRQIQGYQEIMIGYSDSAKDAGFLAATWAQYQTQEKLVAVSRRHQVKLTLFHGRGGSASRGGAPFFEAIVSQPPGSVDGNLRITEQGEVIRSKFSPEGVAIRTLEMYVAATLQATLLPPPEPRAQWRQLMEQMANTSLQAYRGLIREDQRFIPYFRNATPEQELQRLPLGSRPARRKAGGGVESLRAIPWVFAWTQMRLMLPAWLGVDDALQEVLNQGKLQDLQEMYQNWPHCQMIFGMLEMVLAKSDVEIARYYEQRLADAGDRELGEQLRSRLLDMVDLVKNLLGHSVILQNNPAIRRSIEVRNPYIDPLHVLQVELMRRSRIAEQKGESLPDAKALMVTVAGIAAGMRNTG